MVSPVNAYILCSTPRTGSTLLCSLLQATGVAGYPESYFRSQDIAARAKAWGICRQDGSFTFEDYLNCVLERGRSTNDVFSTRVMWGTMAELTSNLRLIGTAGDDLEVLSQAFGTTKFVYLERIDRVAQAISRLRAEQTHVWHVTDSADHANPKREAFYNEAAIQHYIDESEAHDRAWNKWFHQNNILPLRLNYEDLDAAAIPVVHQVLDFIGVDHPKIPITASNVRMADDMSAEWAQRFRSNTGYSD